MAATAGLVGAVLIATTLAACGDDASSDGPNVTQRIARDFGHELLSAERAPLEEGGRC